MNKIILILLLLPIIAFPQSVYFDGDDYTKEVIVNYRNGDSKGTVITWARFNNFDAENYVFCSADEATTNYYLLLSVTPNGATGQIRIAFNNAVDNGVVKGTTTDIAVDTWYHLVWISNGTSYQLYMNGVSQSLSLVGGTHDGHWFGDVVTRDNLMIGAAQTTGAVSPMAGYVDEVAVFSDTLTPAQVTTYYNAGRIYDLRDEASLVGYWKCNENTGITISGVVGSEVFDFAAATADPSWSTEHVPTTFYVSDQGSDTDDGEDLTTALLTVDNAASRAVQPNDSVAIFTGDEFRETVTMDGSGTSGNPITISVVDSATGLTGAAALALGDTATISGADLVTTWTLSTDSSVTVVDSDAHSMENSAKANYNWRIEITAGDITVSGDRIKITIGAHDDSLVTIVNAYIGEKAASGDAYDMESGTITQITFGDTTGAAVTAGTDITSDWIVYAFDHTKNYIISIGQTNSYTVDYGNETSNYKANAQADAGTANVTGYNGTNNIYCMEQFDVGTLNIDVWKATLAGADSTKMVSENGKRLTAVSSIANINSSGKFYHDAGNNLLYMRSTDDADPNGHTIDAFQRRFCVYMNMKSWITIDGLKLINTQFGNDEYDRSAGVRIQIDNYAGTYQGWVIKNCIIEDHGSTSIYGLIDTGTEVKTITGLTITNNTIRECNWILGAEEQMLRFNADMTNGYGWQNVTIDSNTIYQDITINPDNNGDPGTNGIYIEIQGGINTINNNEIEGTSHGIVVTGTDSSGTYAIINNNNIHDTSDDGIWVKNNMDSVEAYYNIIYNTLDNGIDTYKENANDSSFYVNLYNNVIYNVTNPGLDITRIQNAILKNNIIIDADDASNKYAIQIDDNATDVTLANLDSDNNLFYRTGGAAINIRIVSSSVTATRTLAQWRSNEGQGNNSIESDPLFTDAVNDDFTLQAKSPCIDAGTDVSLTLDYLGNVVPAPVNKKLVDIGAYEYFLSFGYEKRFKRFSDFWRYKRH